MFLYRGERSAQRAATTTRSITVATSIKAKMQKKIDNLEDQIDSLEYEIVRLKDQTRTDREALYSKDMSLMVMEKTLSFFMSELGIDVKSMSQGTPNPYSSKAQKESRL